MADSEVRQKFEATVKNLGATLDKLQPGTGPGVGVLMMMAWDEAFEAGMRAGEIAEREKIRNAARAEYDKDTEQTAVNCADTTPESIYLNGFLVGIEAVYKAAAHPAAPEEKK